MYILNIGIEYTQIIKSLKMLDNSQFVANRIL